MQSSSISSFTGGSFKCVSILTGADELLQFFGSAQHVLCTSSCTAPAVRGRVKAGDQLRAQVKAGVDPKWLGVYRMSWG